jgi:hypothetical protein
MSQRLRHNESTPEPTAAAAAAAAAKALTNNQMVP